MTVAVAAETRISHSVARVSAAPAVAPRSLSRQVRDSSLQAHTKTTKGGCKDGSSLQEVYDAWIRT